MRKRTILNLADTVFWLVVALLPILLYAVSFLPFELTSFYSFDSFESFMASMGINSSGVVFDSLSAIFGTGGILPLFADSSVVVVYLSYFVCVQIVRLAVEFLLFIPKLCRKWMDNFTSKEV